MPPQHRARAGWFQPHPKTPVPQTQDQERALLRRRGLLPTRPKWLPLQPRQVPPEKSLWLEWVLPPEPGLK
jgi:hypothetical protein